MYCFLLRCIWVFETEVLITFDFFVLKWTDKTRTKINWHLIYVSYKRWYPCFLPHLNLKKSGQAEFNLADSKLERNHFCLQRTVLRLLFRPPFVLTFCKICKHYLKIFNCAIDNKLREESIFFNKIEATWEKLITITKI